MAIVIESEVCGCSESLELRELLEAAAVELDARDEHLAHLRDLLSRMLDRSDSDELGVGCPDLECTTPGCLDMMVRRALLPTQPATTKGT